MSDVFKRLSDATKTIQSDQSLIDKIDVLNYAEELDDTITQLITTLSQPDISQTLDDIVNTRAKDEVTQAIVQTHNLVFHDLPSRTQSDERHHAFGCLVPVLEILQKDLDAIRSNFPKLFGVDQTTELKLSDIKVSTMIVVGYLEVVVRFVSWCVYLVTAVTESSDKESGFRMPPYQLKALVETAHLQSQLMNDVLSRPVGTTILSEIEQIRERGGDVYIQTQGEGLDAYAHERDYKAAELNYIGGFMYNLVSFVGNKLITYRRERYEQLKAMREFMATKVSLLHLQMSRMDNHQSQEYKKLEKIAANYANLIAQHDKKIKDYETR